MLANDELIDAASYFLQHSWSFFEILPTWEMNQTAKSPLYPLISFFIVSVNQQHLEISYGQ